MSERDEKLAASLTAESTRLLPYLPALLQDIFFLGGSPDMIVEMLRQNVERPGALKILDLACGKGAVAITLAKEFGAAVTGVDLLEPFIQEARKKAEEYGVSHLCTFEAGDVNEAVQTHTGYDCVVFAAAGDVLGSQRETLQKLKGTLRPGGFILLDESYLKSSGEEVRYRGEHYITLEAFAALLRETGLQEAARMEMAPDAVDEVNDHDLKAIARRVEELSAQHPQDKALFEGYLRSQQNEVSDIEESLVNLVQLLTFAP